MKSEIRNRILSCIFASGILISGIGIETAIKKNEIQKSEQKIEIRKLDCNIDKEILFSELQFLNLDFDKEENIEHQDDVYFDLTESDRAVILNIVAGEAKGESTEGKMAVAQCLLNAMEKEGMSANEIRIKYKYSGWDSDLQNSNPDLWVEVEEAVSRVFDGGEFVSENPILFFYAPKYAKGKWHETLMHDQTIGGHKFFYLEEDVTANWFLNLKGGNQNGN